MFSDMILQMIEDTNFVISKHVTTLDMLGSHPTTLLTVLQWAHALAKSKYTCEIKEMTAKTPCWHFSVLYTEVTHPKSFDLNEIAHEMSSQSLCVWDLWNALLTSDLIIERCLLWHLFRKHKKGAVMMDTLFFFIL